MAPSCRSLYASRVSSPKENGAGVARMALVGLMVLQTTLGGECGPGLVENRRLDVELQSFPAGVEAGQRMRVEILALGAGACLRSQWGLGH